MHVYILQRPDGLLKIGFSADPTKRLRALETQSGFDAASVWVSVPVENAKAVEAKAHEALADHAMLGEWFQADLDDAIQAVVDALSGVGDEAPPIRQEFDLGCTAGRLLYARSLTGMTQTQLAEKSGATRDAIAKAETGVTRLPREIEAIASALGVCPAWLAFGVGEVPQPLRPTTARIDADTLPERLLLTLKSKGITQNTLAEALDVSKGTVSHWIANRHSASVDQIAQISAILGISPAWLAFGHGPIEQDAVQAADILAPLTPAQRAQALRMLEAFAASCAPEDTA